MRVFLSLFAALFLLLGAAPTLAEGSVVRVRLFEQHQPQTVTLSCAEGRLAVYAGTATEPINYIEPGTEATITRRDQEVRMAFGDLAFFAMEVRILPEKGATMLLSVGATASEAPRIYEGELRLAADRDAVKVINHVPLETYVAAVITREYGFDDLEGNKAMAVLARTYALHHLNPAGDYDLGDYIGSQVYKGVGALNKSAVEATRQTEGEILLYDGEPVDAVYFASSGGHTASNETVWSSRAMPYLRARPDPFDDVAPYQEWTTTIPRASLLRLLSQRYNRNVTGFFLGDRSSDGRVQYIRLRSSPEKTILSNEFRLLVNQHFGEQTLRSTFITEARRDGDQYVIEGKGYGHGVGLSQWGAHAMAEQGFGYHDILGYYYQEVELNTTGPLAPGAAAFAVADARTQDPDRQEEPPPFRPARADSEQPTDPVRVRERPSEPLQHWSAPRRPSPQPKRRIGW